MADTVAEPTFGWVGAAHHHTSSEVACGKGAGRVEDMLIDGRAPSHRVWGDEPFISAWEDIVGKFSGVNPPGIAVNAEAD